MYTPPSIYTYEESKTNSDNQIKSFENKIDDINKKFYEIKNNEEISSIFSNESLKKENNNLKKIIDENNKYKLNLENEISLLKNSIDQLKIQLVQNNSKNNIISVIEEFNNSIINKKYNNNIITSYKKYYCTKCNQIPLLYLTYIKNENYYDLLINYKCKNNHENKLKISKFLNKNIKEEYYGNKNNNYDINLYNKTKEKIELFSNNIKLIKIIGQKYEQKISELNKLIKYYEELNNLEINFTNLLLDIYKNENLDNNIEENIIQLLNFNDNYFKYQNLNDMQLLDNLFIYLNKTNNFFLKPNIYQNNSISTTNTSFNDDNEDLNQYDLKLTIKENNINKILILNDYIIIMISNHNSIIFYNINENKKILEMKESNIINDIIKLNDNFIVYNNEKNIKILNINSYTYDKIVTSELINKIINYENGFIITQFDYFTIFKYNIDKYEEIKKIKSNNKEITSIISFHNNKIITISYEDSNMKLFESFNNTKSLKIICNNSKDCLYFIEPFYILLYGIETLYLINSNDLIIINKINNFILSFINIYNNNIIISDDYGNLIKYTLNKLNQDFMQFKYNISTDNAKINYITQSNNYIISYSIDGQIKIFRRKMP
jgi:hypothetical protein